MSRLPNDARNAINSRASGATRAIVGGLGGGSLARRGGSALINLARRAAPKVKSVIKNTGQRNVASATRSRLTNLAKPKASHTTVGVAATAATGLSALAVAPKVYNARKNRTELEKSQSNSQNQSNAPIQSFFTPGDLTGDERGDLSKGEYKDKYGISWKDTDAGKSATKQRKQNMRMIGNGWDEMTGEHNRIKNEVQGYRDNAQKTTRKLRDSYLSAADENYKQNNTAISGQSQLIRRDQTEALGDIAKDAQREHFSTNLRLGAANAADSSAAKMASRGIQRATEASRRGILKQVSTQIAGLNQRKRELTARYKRQRADAYKMEEDMKEQAISEYNEQISALKRLRKSSPKWRQKDIDNEEDSRLQRLASSLSQIANNAQLLRGQIHEQQAGVDREIEDLKLQAALTFAPPELEAQEIDGMDALDIGDDEEDFYNPQAPKRERIESKVKSVLDDDEDEL